VSPTAVTALVAIGFGIVLVRRRGLAIVLVGAQALLLGIGALSLDTGGGSGMAVAGVILLVRAAALPALLLVARSRTREPALVVPATTMVVRLVVGAAVVAVAVAALPPLGLGDPAVEHGAVALLCLGIATVVTRRPAILQIIGVIVAENGVYLLAISVPGGLPSVVELGVLLDLILLVTVTVAFSRKIHEEVGSGDVDLLRGLRD
jgi:hydrogenase-4 component E